MNRKSIAAAAALAAATMGFSCAGGDDSGGGTDVDMRVWMDVVLDAPIAAPTRDEDVNAIFITFDSMSVHHEEFGWIERSISTGLIDLMSPGRVPVLLATWPGLPAGEYDQLRFHVKDASVVVYGTAYPLDIPSGDTSGLKVHTELCLEPTGEIESLELAWQADHQLHHSKERGWWLTPSIVVTSAPGCDDYDGDDHDDDDALESPDRM